MNTSIIISDPTKTAHNRAIALSSTHIRNKPRKRRTDLSKPRTQAQFGTKSYNDGLQRAFNKAKQQIFFNPDMKYLLTLTYAENMQDLDRAMYDIKQWLKTERRKGHTNLKYIFIFEYQKRGAIHVHMICNADFETFTNDNGYLQLEHWRHGWSSFLPIKNLDNNFRPYLYLFKYMKKTQRIGKSFVHTSKNLNCFKPLDDYEFNRKLHTKVFEEKFSIKVNDDELKYHREFYEYIPIIKTYDILKGHTITQTWETELWKKTKLAYTKGHLKKPEKIIEH